MASPRFGIAPFKLSPAAIQKERRDIFAARFAHGLDPVDDGSGVKPARPGVDAKGQGARRGGSFWRARRKEAVEQCEREVVHNLPAKVFECFERGCLASP